MTTQPYPIEYHNIRTYSFRPLYTQHSVINFQFGTRSLSPRLSMSMQMCVSADLCFPMMMWGLRGSLRLAKRGENIHVNLGQIPPCRVFCVYTTPSSTTTTTNKRQGKYLAYHSPSFFIFSPPQPHIPQKQQQIKKATRWLMNYSLSRDAWNPKVKTSLVPLRFITQILYRTQ